MRKDMGLVEVLLQHFYNELEEEHKELKKDYSELEGSNDFLRETNGFLCEMLSDILDDVNSIADLCEKTMNENLELEKENKKLKQENDILRESNIYYSLEKRNPDIEFNLNILLDSLFESSSDVKVDGKFIKGSKLDNRVVSMEFNALSEYDKAIIVHALVNAK